ncbi:MAG: acyl-CoA dehydrogenase [Hyphomicrobiaceae bacterium]
MAYRAPIADIAFALETAGGVDRMIASGAWAGLDRETIHAVLEEAGRFGAEVLDPLNWLGDRQGSRLENGTVVTPDGWDDAYRRFVDGGWASLAAPEAYGGQDLPLILSMAVSEVWNASNMSFGLCPLLTQGAIDALLVGGSEEQKAMYLPKMVAGTWTGTMNLTEPQAGSDLALLRARAEPAGDGTYRVFGTKIYITYGEHELSENIIHLVLARLPDAPEGTRGISLFLVPKYLVNADGSLGRRNDVICTGLEHKLGIHASPTCTMKYGENGGAVGYLVGEGHRGLVVMFVMMNVARLAVGVQGVAIADRATQRAVSYAKERVQGRAVDKTSAGASAIIDHPDVRRTLLTMRAMTQAARLICFATAREMDLAHRAPTEVERQAASHRAALLTPIAKAYSTDVGNEVASLGVQVHGGMGFVEETGAAQHLRDARILPIYEGTNGIQAIDLVTRKVPLANGAVIRDMIAEFAATAAEIKASNRPEFGRMGQRLEAAVQALESASQWMGEQIASNPKAALATATPYLRLFGLTAGGAYLARGALGAARTGADGAVSPYIAMARIFAEGELTLAPSLGDLVTTGSDAMLDRAADGLLA